jgi:hypothetical protein
MFSCLSLSPLLTAGRGGIDVAQPFEMRKEAQMPGWLTWTLAGLGAWFTLSVPLAFLVGDLLGRRPAPRRRFVTLAGPGSVRVRVRARSR